LTGTTQKPKILTMIQAKLKGTLAECHTVCVISVTARVISVTARVISVIARVISVTARVISVSACH
jgi:hypothetical protein